MFCPRCSQQASDEVSFCSRCGFPLDALAELVESGGHIERVASEESHSLTPRQRGMRKGALVMAAGLLFGVLTLVLTLFKEDFFMLMFPAALGFIYGFMRLLYGVLLEDDSARAKTAKKTHATPGEKSRAGLEAANARVSELPPARAVPVNAFRSARADTSDMAAPPSVTESTTRLLEENAEGDALK